MNSQYAGSDVQPEVHRGRAMRRLWRAEYLYIVALICFAVLAALAHHYAYFGWDLASEREVQELSWPWMAAAMRAVSVFGNGITPVIITSLSIVVFLAAGRRAEAAGILFSAGGGELTNGLLKLLIARPRPSADLVTVFKPLSTESFPSGHVTFYVCFFGFLFLIAYALLRRDSALRRVAMTAAAAPVALVGLSRVYLGEHWPSDTIGAYLFSGIWLGLSLHVYRRLKERETLRLNAAADRTRT